MLMEKCPFSVLDHLNSSPTFLSEQEILEIFGGMVAGFSYIHCNALINRDCKIENLLLTQKKNITSNCVKICDFGSCTNRLFKQDELI